MKRNLFLLLFLLSWIFGILVWNYLYHLHEQFPNLDLNRIRLGIASWYSETDQHIQERTANGEFFDDERLTCASWYYPFHEKLLVINLLNLKWVVCRVNDRGPHKRLRREIDLSKASFARISKLRRGLIPVLVVPTEKKAMDA